jgi:NitT/TauT family transport system substrate-binding protein
MRRCSDRIGATTGLVRIQTAAVVSLTVICVLAGALPARAQSQPLTVAVRLADVSLNKLPFVVAYEEGIYAKNGLQVEQFVAAEAAAVARLNGVIVPEKYILKPGSPAIPISVGGACPTVVRFTTTPGTAPTAILASTDPVVRTHIVSRLDITTPEQLKGKRLGYSANGATTHLAALSFVQVMGWTPGKDIFLVSDGNNVTALKEDKVDAFVASELFETMAVAAGFRDLVDLSKYNMPMAGSSLVANRAWLKDNQEAARRLVKSLVDALALIKQDKNVALRAMTKWYDIKEPKLQEYFYNKVSLLPRKPYPPYDGLKKTMELFDNPEMRKHRVEDFYDDSFVRQLDQSGYIDGLYK